VFCSFFLSFLLFPCFCGSFRSLGIIFFETTREQRQEEEEEDLLVWSAADFEFGWYIT